MMHELEIFNGDLMPWELILIERIFLIPKLRLASLHLKWIRRDSLVFCIGVKLELNLDPLLLLSIASIVPPVASRVEVRAVLVILPLILLLRFMQNILIHYLQCAAVFF
jgi:hypothetical protein